MHYFTASELCVILQYLCVKMVHNIHDQVGRPRKYSGGWNSVNKCICISNETFPTAVDSINELSLSCIANNIILSTILVKPFRMKKAS